MTKGQIVAANVSKIYLQNLILHKYTSQYWLYVFFGPWTFTNKLYIFNQDFQYAFLQSKNRARLSSLFFIPSKNQARQKLLEKAQSGSRQEFGLYKNCKFSIFGFCNFTAKIASNLQDKILPPIISG